MMARAEVRLEEYRARRDALAEEEQLNHLLFRFPFKLESDRDWPILPG